jgi:4-hydroxybutyryl-CoA dehydratase/vinylacetyl-CoA-Delta-isomerase
MPSEKDYRHPEVGKMLEKYLKGVEGVPTEDRMRIVRLIERMTCGRTLLVCMHGAGSPFANKMMIGRYTDMEAKKRLAKDIAGVGESRAKAGPAGEKARGERKAAVADKTVAP